jgi:penicillin-binding protein 1A
VVLALRLERSFSKDEILQLYINQIYFGEGAYGVETASRKFFGKPAKDLSVAEAAVLAGIPKNPARYSPHRNPRNAVARRNVVLAAMRKTGAIGAAEMEAARAESLIVLDGVSRAGVSGAAPYFVEEVRKALETEFGSEAIYTGGLKVYTTLDLDIQEEAERALEHHLHEVERYNGYWYLKGRPGPDDAVPVASTLPGDATRELQGAALGLDPRSGAVRFMVGGRDFSRSKFNRATQARRQPGSAFKPFIYVTAIETGKVTTDVLLDAPIVRFLPNGDRWEPTNYSRTYSGLVALREALAKSINIPAVLLLEELGVDKVRQKARELGIASPLPRVLSLALGTGEVTLMELTAAYGPFANRGIYAEPYLISRVEDRAGKVLLETRPRTREVLDEGVADLMSDLLSTVITSGTGEGARREGLTGDAAGKTGTTDDYTDAWFIGYQSGLLAGVWVGFDLKLQIGHDMTGSFCALPIWTAIMKTAGERYPPEPFPRSDRLVRVRVCRESGRLATPSCPADGVISETFLKGSEPELRCGFHQD